MHKPKNHHRHRNPHKEEAHKARWAKYLAAPVVIIAIAATGKLLCNKPESHPQPKPQAAEVSEQSSEKVYLTPQFPDRFVVLYDKDIVASLTSDCCRVAILRRGSRGIGDIVRSIKGDDELEGSFALGNPDDIRGLTFGEVREPGKSPRGFCMVKNPQDLLGDERADAYEPTIFEALLPSARQKILQVAGHGNLRDRELLVSQIVSELPFGESENIHNIYRFIEQNSGKDAADQMIRRIAAGTVLKNSIGARTPSGLQRERARFVNLVVHEAVHGAMKDYRASVDNIDDFELFGHMSETAYGENCWYSLQRMLIDASSYFPQYALEYARAQGITDGTDVLEKEIKYMKFFERLFSLLAEKLGLHGLLQLPDMGEEQIRAAARAVLDDHSMALFGKRFADIVPIGDILDIRRQAEAYFDSLQLSN